LPPSYAANFAVFTVVAESATLSDIMDAKELFSAAIRVIGLLAAGRGIGDLLYVLAHELGGPRDSVMTSFPETELILGIFYLAIGLYFLRGAPVLIAYAFPERSQIYGEPGQRSGQPENEKPTDAE
jgi:hypothetical protein